VRVVPGTSMILAFQVSGVVETPAVWVRRTETASWVRVVRHEDGMMNLALHGTRAYIKTKGGAGGAVSNGRVVSFDLASQTFESAQTLIPASDLVLSANRGTGLVTAADAVYVYGFRDGTGVVLRVPYDGNTKPSELHLPISGTITGVDADPRRPGFLCVMSGWTMPQLIYSYTPSSSTFADTHLQPHNPRISP
jgi:dipeptidyl aminopeptidase/acylaminoacyl peptidase